MYNNPYQNFLNQTNPQYPAQNFNNYQPQPVQPIQNKQDVVQVNGLEGAKAYQMVPNSRVLLLDEKEPVVYIKCSDGANFATLSAYKLIPIEEKKEKKHSAENLNEEIEKRIKRLEEKMEGIINEQSVIKSNNLTSTDGNRKFNAGDTAGNAAVKRNGKSN